MIHDNAFTRAPSQEKRSDGILSQEQIKHFFEKGWLVVDNVFPNDVLDGLKTGIEKQTNELVDKLYNAGKIQNKHEDKGFFQRMSFIEEEFPDAAILLHRSGLMPDGLKEVWSQPNILDITEQLLGPEVAAHPVWNLRVKLPEVESGVVPWHQDAAYFNDDARETLILTAWVPLLNATEFNGGMQVVEGTHKRGVVAEHFCCAGGTFYLEIEMEDIENTFECCVEKEKQICDVPYGGVLLFSNMIVHRSSNNRSNDIRWSVDLRWQNPSKPNGREKGEEKMPIMRSLQDPVKQIDWSCLVNRQIADRKQALDEEHISEVLENEFETRLSGPWMKRWPIKHHNKHTEMV